MSPRVKGARLDVGAGVRRSEGRSQAAPSTLHTTVFIAVWLITGHTSQEQHELAPINPSRNCSDDWGGGGPIPLQGE